MYWLVVFLHLLDIIKWVTAKKCIKSKKDTILSSYSILNVTPNIVTPNTVTPNTVTPNTVTPNTVNLYDNSNPNTVILYDNPNIVMLYDNSKDSHINNNQYEEFNSIRGKSNSSYTLCKIGSVYYV